MQAATISGRAARPSNRARDLAVAAKYLSFDIGISLPGTFEEPVAPVFIDGALDRTLRGDRIVDEFKAILESYVERRFPAPGARR